MQIKLSELKNLSQEQLAAIASQAMKIREANKHRSLESYLESAHDGQRDFHKSDKRIRFFFGGNRSGKTTAGTIEMLWRLQGTHPFQKTRTPIKAALIVQDFENHCRSIIEPKFNQWAPPNIIDKAERNQNGAWRHLQLKNGSTMDIFSHDQDIKVFEGSDFDVAWFDEPPPQRVFSAIWRGLTDRGGVCYITGTPIVGPWMYQEIKKAESGTDPLRWFIFVDTDQNATNIGEGDAALGKKRIQEFIELLPPEEREARKSGRFLQMQGLIFKEWQRSHHLVPAFSWPAHWPIIESIDPHPAKPWAVSWVGLAENGSKVLLRSGLYEGVLEQVADQILVERTELNIEHGRRPRIVKTLIDNSASVPLMQRSNNDPTARRKSLREELELLIGPAYGYPKVEVAPKNVKQKIELFKALLNIRRVDEENVSGFYALDIPENERFIYEIENYVWDTKRGGILNGLKDIPVKKDDDILDTIMQVVLTLPREGVSNEIIRMGKTDSYRG